MTNENRARSALVAPVVVCLLLSHAAAAGTIWSENGHEYAVVDAYGISWHDAYDSARSRGWHLATIGSEAENDFVKSLLGDQPNLAQFWLGATDEASEGTFEWIDDTEFQYTDWFPGEPNSNYGITEEDFLAMDLRDGVWAWNDEGPSSRVEFGFVMERDIPAAPEPGSLATFGLGLASLVVSRWRRRSSG